jgi:hypothetical protein
LRSPRSDDLAGDEPTDHRPDNGAAALPSRRFASINEIVSQTRALAVGRDLDQFKLLRPLAHIAAATSCASA